MDYFVEMDQSQRRRPEGAKYISDGQRPSKIPHRKSAHRKSPIAHRNPPIANPPIAIPPSQIATNRHNTHKKEGIAAIAMTSQV
jgi:hypothetical protein